MLDLLRISRLFNPEAEFFLLADGDVISKNAYYRGELENVGVQVRHRESYRRNESRAALYEALHYADADQKHPPEMLARFCEVADLARAEGLERVFMVDADVGIFSDVEALFRLYHEDIVTPCDYCSQVALWSAAALDRFCDALIGFWAHSAQERSALLASFRIKDAPVNNFNDMHFLAMFLNGTAASHNLTFSVLTKEPACARNPTPALWAAGVSARMLRPDILDPPLDWLSLANFDYFSDYWEPCNELGAGTVYWDQVEWSVPYVVPLAKKLHYPFPLIHFQQLCKYDWVHGLFIKHYQQHLPPWADPTGPAARRLSS